jgi:hypothetical protein
MRNVGLAVSAKPISFRDGVIEDWVTEDMTTIKITHIADK